MSASRSENFKIRLMTESDLDAVAEHHIAVYHSQVGAEFLKRQYRWKFFESPLGKGIAAIAIDPKGACVGIYGGFPLRVKLADHEEIMYMISANSVLPSFEGRDVTRALFSFFSRSVLQWTPAKGIVGFPTRRSVARGGRSFDYDLKLTIRRYVVPLNPYMRLRFKADKAIHKVIKLLVAVLSQLFPPPDLTVSPRGFESVRIQKISALPSDYEPFLDKVNQQYPNLFSRSRELSAWRFLKLPDAQLELYEVRNRDELVGFFVLKPAYHSVTIEDFLTLRNWKLANRIFFELMEMLRKRRSVWWVHLSVHDPFLEEILMEYQPMLLQSCSFGICQLAPIAPEVYRQFSKAYDWNLSNYEYGIS